MHRSFIDYVEDFDITMDVAIAKLLELPDIKEQISVKKQFFEEIKDFGVQDFQKYVNGIV